MPKSTALVLVLSASLAACAQSTERTNPTAAPEPKQESAKQESAKQGSAASPSSPGSQADSAQRKAFGTPIALAEVTTLDAIAADPQKFANKTVKTEGTVTAVCQHMGCWMEIGDPTKNAHIKMAGHSFFVPKDASGHHAIVEGQVVPGQGSGGACMHEGKDSCASDAPTKLQIEATGVELID